MKIELWDIGRIKPYPNNPRVNDAAVAAVAASLKEFSWQQPLVVDTEGMLVVGHTRWKAAQHLGWPKVPVHVATELTPAQCKAYRIADNQTASIAEWDYELLPAELTDLKDLAFDLSLLGFKPDELAQLFDGDAQDGLTDPDDVPLPPDQAVTQPGDLWIMGDHRLLCADSSKPEDVDRLLAGAPIHLVNTDPPYNVRVEPRSNNAIAAGNSSFAAPSKKKRTHHQSMDLSRHPEKSKPTTKKMRAKDRPLANDFVTDEHFEKLLNAWFGNIARVLLPGRALYCWSGYANCANYPPVLKACGLYFSQAIIWVKEHPVLTRKDFMGNHEWCFYSWKEGAGHKFFGPNNVPDVWSIKKVSSQKMVHLTEKPVELAVRAMQYSSVPGENVLDLFGGSGSTLIGAQQTKRKAFLMEIDAPYCDVIADRFQRFTGQPAILERTGESPIPMKPRDEKMQ